MTSQERAALIADLRKWGAYQDTPMPWQAQQACIRAADALEGKTMTDSPIIYSQDAACREAVDWLEMESLIWRTEGKSGNAAMALNVARLIERMMADEVLAGAGTLK